MIFYQLDYVVDEIRKNEPSREQAILRKLTGENFTREEADFIWERVIDHKWYIGERLKRDVGERVAAVDYVENFYESANFFNNKKNQSGVLRRIGQSFAQLGRSYLVSKSRIFSD